jgi:hypothetical protein
VLNGASEFQKRASTMIALSESPDRWLIVITRRRVGLPNSLEVMYIFEIATSQTYRTKTSLAFLGCFPNKTGYESSSTYVMTSTGKRGSQAASVF